MESMNGLRSSVLGSSLPILFSIFACHILYKGALLLARGLMMRLMLEIRPSQEVVYLEAIKSALVISHHCRDVILPA